LHPDFFFVNIGASDGVSNDPIHPFVLRFGWRGLLVEPVPHVFELELLRANYAGFSGMRFENAIVAATPRPLFFFPEDYCRTHPWARQASSLDGERIRWALAHIAKENLLGGAEIADVELIKSEQLPTLAPQQLLEAHSIERFDLLSLDAEGADLEILQGVDLLGLGVRAVVVETRPDPHDGRISALLEDLGFHLIGALDWATDAFLRDE
jgi:FkbM family methyltransferase